MTRSVPDWVGRDDDHVPPPRVRVRVFERCGGKCGQCGRKINAGESWTLEHLVAISVGGANAESNLGVTCGFCLPAKNAADAKLKSKGARIRAKHLGIRKPSRMPGSRHSRFKRTIDGRVIDRATGLEI